MVGYINKFLINQFSIYISVTSHDKQTWIHFYLLLCHSPQALTLSSRFHHTSLEAFTHWQNLFPTGPPVANLCCFHSSSLIEVSIFFLSLPPLRFQAVYIPLQLTSFTVLNLLVLRSSLFRLVNLLSRFNLLVRNFSIPPLTTS